MSAGHFTVLVICTGNVNRSPLGALLLEKWSAWYLPSEVAGAVRVGSAGLRAPVGARMGRRARAIAEALGADGSVHRAAQVTEATIRSADLVLVSSADQRDAVLGLVPAALRSTFTIREAGRIAASVDELPPPVSADELRERVAILARNRSLDAPAPGDDDIVDPQGKDDEAYRLMTRQEVPPLGRLARHLFGMPDAEIDAYERVAAEGAFRFADTSEPQLASEPARARGRHEA